MKLTLLTVAILLVAVVLLGVKVLFVKGAEFPSGHIGANSEMRRRGITCAHGGDASSRRQGRETGKANNA